MGLSPRNRGKAQAGPPGGGPQSLPALSEVTMKVCELVARFTSWMTLVRLQGQLSGKKFLLLYPKEGPWHCLP